MKKNVRKLPVETSIYFKDTCMVIALYICSQLQIYKVIKEEYRVGGKWCI